MALDTFAGSLLSVRLSLLLSSRYMQASKMESSNCFGEKMEIFLYATLKLACHCKACTWRKIYE